MPRITVTLSDQSAREDHVDATFRRGVFPLGHRDPNFSFRDSTSAFRPVDAEAVNYLKAPMHKIFFPDQTPVKVTIVMNREKFPLDHPNDRTVSRPSRRTRNRLPMNGLMEKIDHWIFREYAPLTRGLPLYRIVVGALADPAHAAGKLRGFRAAPIRFTRRRSDPPFSSADFRRKWFFWGLDYLSELAAFCLLFGYRTRLASFGLAALLVFGNVFRYSAGKIDHDILLIAILFCLGGSDWGSRFSSDARRPRLIAGRHPRGRKRCSC